jgi:hypothetical protein
VRDQLLTLVPHECLAHGVDQQALEARTLQPLEDDLVEASEPADPYDLAPGRIDF